MTDLTAAPALVPAVTDVCPNCGDTVQAGGRGRGRVFCRPKCRELFSNRSKTDGAALYAYVMAWQETRHAKPGTEEAEICRLASREVGAICRMLRDEGKAAGRPPMAKYVATLFRNGDRFMDRTRRA
jgi:hypothetical protein